MGWFDDDRNERNAELIRAYQKDLESALGPAARYYWSHWQTAEEHTKAGEYDEAVQVLNSIWRYVSATMKYKLKVTYHPFFWWLLKVERVDL